MKQLTRHPAVTLALLLGTALTGASWACRAHRSDGLHRAGPPPPLDPMRELPGDPEVERELEMLQPLVAPSERDRVLRFDLRNRSASALRFDWAVEWYDRAGERIPVSARAWTPMTLEAGAIRPIQVLMPSPDASSWRLRAVHPGGSTSHQGDPR